MWKKITGYLKQIIPLMQNSLLPALILYTVISIFLGFAPLNKTFLGFLHIGFFLVCGLSVALLFYTNSNRPLFFILGLVLSYCLINYLKFKHGIIYNLSDDYINLSFLTAVSLLFFYFLPNRPLFSQDTINFIIILFATLALGELLEKQQIALEFSNFICNSCGLQIFGISMFLTVFLVTLFHSSVHNDIISVNLFFAIIEVALGFYLSDRPTPLVLFFFTAALTVLSGIIHLLYYSKRKDTVTGLNNGNTFIANASSLPYKYELAIISIDDYKHLFQIFKKNGTNEIVNMIAKKICEIEPEALVYRCRADEFIVIVSLDVKKGKDDKSEAERIKEKRKNFFANIDKFRSNIASSEFMLSGRKKGLKLTVSCCIAEKKRSDADVFSVYLRTQKILQKAYKFTQNITSQA